jgi:predicted DNA-binding transcriptional regulator AlpA
MSLQTTVQSREERAGGRGGGGIDYVRTVVETAHILGMSEPALRCMLQRGEGPRVTQLSARRIGIRDSDRNAWLNTRQVSETAAA